MIFVGVAFVFADKGDVKPLTLFDPVPPGSGTQVPPRELSVRELTKPRTDLQYGAQVGADLARTKTDPDARKEKIRRFISGGVKSGA